MMIDGERIPSPEADVRQVALDVIPADLLQAVEVSKALTPDMDADAIGGGVNLVMKQAPGRRWPVRVDRRRLQQQPRQRRPAQRERHLGRRFDGNKIGVVSRRARTARHAATRTSSPCTQRQPHRPRPAQLHGATAAGTARPGRSTSVRRDSQLTRSAAIYNHFIDDHEERQRWRNRVANRRLERELRDRTHVEHIWSASLHGRTRTRAARRSTTTSQGAHSDQRDPGTITTTFRQSNVNFAPNVTPTSIDPDNVQANPLNENLDAYTFNAGPRHQQQRRPRHRRRRRHHGHGDARSTRLTAFLKGGFKVRDKNKERTRDEVTLTSPTTIPLTSRA